ncbi:hypothetical protein VTK56DRAFT_9531 [Thermocarpiscus australiensis]
MDSTSQFPSLPVDPDLPQNDSESDYPAFHSMGFMLRGTDELMGSPHPASGFYLSSSLLLDSGLLPTGPNLPQVNADSDYAAFPSASSTLAGTREQMSSGSQAAYPDLDELSALSLDLRSLAASTNLGQAEGHAYGLGMSSQTLDDFPLLEGMDERMASASHGGVGPAPGEPSTFSLDLQNPAAEASLSHTQRPSHHPGMSSQTFGAFPQVS